MPRFPRRPFAAALFSGAALLVVGCSNDSGQEYGTDIEGADDEHVHAEAEHPPGPHGGTVLELTTDHKLHAELVAESDDPAQGKLYMLAGDMQTPVKARSVAFVFADEASGEETNVALDAADGAEGDSAEWTFLRESLPNQGEGDLAGRIVVVDAEGAEYDMPFDTGHDAHAGHDHDHDHGDHDHDHDDHDHEGEDHDEHDHE